MMNSLQEKKYTHWGIPIIGFLSLWVLFFLFLLTRTESINWLFFTYSAIITILLFGILCVYNITITIDDSYFSFKLGMGLIKRRYNIADIKSCKPYAGFSKRIGIGWKRSVSGNLLEYYIVTGFKAIELQFHNKKAIVLIGTPLAEEISQQIQSQIKKSESD